MSVSDIIIFTLPLFEAVGSVIPLSTRPYISMEKSLVILCHHGWYFRKVISWLLFNMMEANFCVSSVGGGNSEL